MYSVLNRITFNNIKNDSTNKKNTKLKTIRHYYMETQIIFNRSHSRTIRSSIRIIACRLPRSECRLASALD